MEKQTVLLRVFPGSPKEKVETDLTELMGPHGEYHWTSFGDLVVSFDPEIQDLNYDILYGSVYWEV